MALKSGIIGLIGLIGLISPMGLHAAEAPRIYLERVGSFGLRVLIDSDEPVNAYDVAVSYDPGIVEIESLETGESIVTVMPQPVRAADGQIIIKGGSTTAFSGTAGELLSVQLKPITQGVVQFAIIKSMIYRADGTGTEVTATAGDLAMRVTLGTFQSYASSKTGMPDAPADIAAPQIVVAAVEENPFNYGERLLVFQASDPISGVSHYEARDRQWVTWSDWRQAVNPYPVDSGAWAVQLKAVDNSGNFALATVYQFGNAIWKAGLFVVLLAVLLGGLLTLRRRKSGV